MYNLSKKKIIIGCIIAVFVIAGIIFLNRASLNRWLKDRQSQYSNGIQRSVFVYDMEGDLIQEYHGKFDIEWSDDRLRFDDENGKRHIIYFKSGTVIVDED